MQLLLLLLFIHLCSAACTLSGSTASDNEAATPRQDAAAADDEMEVPRDPAPDPESDPDFEDGDDAVDVGDASTSLVPARGDDGTLDIGSWNLEWFGAAEQGPSDDVGQRLHAQQVIDGTDLDIWALCEVVSAASFRQLLSDLPDYQGLMADDASVTHGAAYYFVGEQQLAIVYKSSVATLLSASLILTDEQDVFAGRPPLEARFEVKHGSLTTNLTVIVLHAKASSDASSWNKRFAAAAALKLYLDREHPTDDVIVLGDFNDLIDGSLTPNMPSPYESFASDADYRFITQPLTAMDVGTTVGRTSVIDHHLVTNELRLRYLQRSVEAYRVDAFIDDYESSTSDHYPVLSRYRF